MRNFFGLSFIIVLMFVSCSEKQDNTVIYNEFHGNQWARFEYLNGTFENYEENEYDIIMEIVVSDLYPDPYVNHQKDGSFLFNMTINNPNDSGSRSKDYSYKLKDKEGNWKADKRDGYYTFRLPIINDMTFSEEGIYKFIIENKYHKDPLHGIKSLKVMCVDSNNEK